MFMYEMDVFAGVGEWWGGCMLRARRILPKCRVCVRRGGASLLIIGLLFLGGCVEIQPSYKPPSSGVTAKVTITTQGMEGYYNLRVYFHQGDRCSVQDAKLVGMLNSGAIGYPRMGSLQISVPANGYIGFSAPQIFLDEAHMYPGGILRFSYYQPLVVFDPQIGGSYKVTFSQRTARVTRLVEGVESGVPTSYLDSSCEVTTTNMGDLHKGEIFFLRPKS